MNTRLMISLMIVASSTLIFSGCARNISANVYDSGTIGEASETYQGVIINARKIVVKESERLQDNVVGAGMGGIGGLALGSMIGKGAGNTAAMAVGGLAGAVGGAYAQDYLGTQDGMEYVVKLTNGQIRTVKQGTDSILAVGQRVLLMINHEGRSRVIPDSSPTMDVQPMSHSVYVTPKRRY